MSDSTLHAFLWLRKSETPQPYILFMIILCLHEVQSKGIKCSHHECIKKTDVEISFGPTCEPELLKYRLIFLPLPLENWNGSKVLISDPNSYTDDVFSCVNTTAKLIICTEKVICIIYNLIHNNPQDDLRMDLCTLAGMNKSNDWTLSIESGISGNFTTALPESGSIARDVIIWLTVPVVFVMFVVLFVVCYRKWRTNNRKNGRRYSAEQKQCIDSHTNV